VTAIAREFTRSIQDDSSVQILFSDYVRVGALPEGVVVSIFQTLPPIDASSKGKAIARPVGKFMMGWEHFERVCDLFKQVLTDHHAELSDVGNKEL
jgi:hypothetical protein